ncbi:hypothetical protein [Micromonospora sp. NPDC005174]|uniref:hypothetical protein n=1 Tax=Micromonospora sp. NPDC005174 TaxID=3157018 RepID=UPI0033B4FA17
MTALTILPTTLTHTTPITDIDATGWLISTITITVTDDQDGNITFTAEVTGYDVATKKDETLTFTTYEAIEQFGDDLADVVSDLVGELAAQL